ncbi:MAG TPA: DNA adenine methylase, partial [Spirochaetia bacterium]|nr:DNA adenine methylase [Spirochaetia bacterium]
GPLFGGCGGLGTMLEALNTLPALPEERRYISRHYAPRETASADWRTERLFYTQENARLIDSIRERIEELYPGADRPEHPRFLEKSALVAPLLYEAATHTNTSGVFKACHKGFGGHGKDALTRIMGPVRLQPPVLIPARPAAEVTCQDAAEFLRGRPAEVCYLDPPYTVHQYGSNYFMLNSIARWDKPPVSEEHAPDGRLLHKAGIRADWTRTRSAFCYRHSAREAMRAVLAAADCSHLVVSYSNEGLIGLEELCDMLSETGELSVHSREYGKYPGGKQGLHRTARNIELALVVHRRGSAGMSPRARADLGRVRVARLMTLSFDPAAVRRCFEVRGDAIRVGEESGALLPMRHLWRFPPDCPPPSFTSGEAARHFEETLQGCALPDIRAEIHVLVSLVSCITEPAERAKLLAEALRLLNKLAHRKYRLVYEDSLGLLRDALAPADAPAALRRRLEAMDLRARRRLAASR